MLNLKREDKIKLYFFLGRFLLSLAKVIKSILYQSNTNTVTGGNLGGEYLIYPNITKELLLII